MMNERAIELYKQALEFAYNTVGKEHADTAFFQGIVAGKHAELIVKECAKNVTKVWYEQGLDIRGAELDKFLKRFSEHFGVEQ